MFLRIARWQLTLVAGVLLGMGLVLHGQVAVARHMQDEMDNTFILWRGIGKLTFFLQDNQTQAALAIHGMPRELIREADRGAWVLVGIGGILAVSAFLIHRRSDRAKQTSHGSSRPARA